MPMKVRLLFTLPILTVLLAGCRTHHYQLVQPAESERRITNQPVTIQYSPLEYRFSRSKDRLLMRINNPTDDRIALSSTNSYVLSPTGESHPLPGRVIEPHSYTTLLLPPKPMTGQVTSPSGWGWGPRFYSPMGSYDSTGAFGPIYYPPATASYRVNTPYDWKWTSGPARLNLTYEQNGQSFEHKLELVREPGR